MDLPCVQNVLVNVIYIKTERNLISALLDKRPGQVLDWT